MNESFVLDASAVLCLLKDEVGAARVIEVLPRSSISAVNVAEIVAKLAEAGGSAHQVASAINALHLRVEPFDGEQARVAGMMRPVTMTLGLSLGDRACLALALLRSAVCVTADRVWLRLAEELGVAVEALR